MKTTEGKHIFTEVVESVICDVTGEKCPEVSVINPDKPEFDHAVLLYSGCFGSEYDELNFCIDIHPDLAVALYQLTSQGKAHTEGYALPKFKITIEEKNEDNNSN